MGFQKQEAGVMWMGVMRKARWASVERRFRELASEYQQANAEGDEVKL